jgi:magnesium transporter
MLYYDETQQEIRSEQISLILGGLFLFSFQEMKGDVFDVVRERIRQGKGRIRKAGCDYLAYALIDAVVDHYFLILEKIGEKIERLEEALFDAPRPDTVQQVHDMKRELIYMRKQIWPIREMINNVHKGDFNLVEDTTMIFFKDVYDHCIQVIDTIESYRDVLSGMLDLYLSTMSNRMNEVMKVLTIIATIFIPLSFLAGVYGMNFEFMPELKWKWGYFGLWAIMITSTAGMLTYFRGKKWL